MLKQEDPNGQHETLLNMYVERGEPERERKEGEVTFKSFGNQEERKELLYDHWLNMEAKKPDEANEAKTKVVDEKVVKIV